MNQTEKKISHYTRRDIIDYLLIKSPPYYGGLDIVQFLYRTFDLSKMPSTDRRYSTAAQDITQHMIWADDWEHHYLLNEYLDLLGCADEVFLTFLEQCVHPLVLDNKEDIEATVKIFNTALKSDGFCLFATREFLERPVYTNRPLLEQANLESLDTLEETFVDISEDSPTNEKEPYLIDIAQNSIFDSPQDDSQYECDVFVIMPFAEHFTPIYADHLKMTVEKLGYSIKRGDDFFSKRSIMSDVWSAMYNSKLIIADCTERNPNVFYELGIAHTLDKHVIMITQNMQDIPFDIQHLRVLVYEFTPRGMKRLEYEIENVIQKLLGIGFIRRAHNESGADLLIRAMSIRGYNRQSLAQALNTPYRVLYNWITGKGVPRVAIIKQLSDELKIDLSDLIEAFSDSSP